MPQSTKEKLADDLKELKANIAENQLLNDFETDASLRQYARVCTFNLYVGLHRRKRSYWCNICKAPSWCRVSRKLF